MSRQAIGRAARLPLCPLRLLLISCAAADYQTGIEALNRGDHDRALAELEPLAKSGDNRARWALGYMYRRGLGVPKDPVRAEAWRKRAVQGMLGAPGAKKPTRRDAARVKDRGSGFVINERGQVLTNHHVIAGCGQVRVRSGRKTARGKLAAADARADLALLDLSERLTGKPTVFRRHPRAILGEDVLVASYPLQDLLSHEMHVSVGVVSALAGPRGDARLIQMESRLLPCTRHRARCSASGQRRKNAGCTRASNAPACPEARRASPYSGSHL